jgi:hypothetical protein
MRQLRRLDESTCLYRWRRSEGWADGGGALAAVDGRRMRDGYATLGGSRKTHPTESGVQTG